MLRVSGSNKIWPASMISKNMCSGPDRKNKMLLHGYIMMQSRDSLIKNVVMEEKKWHHKASWNYEIEGLFKTYNVCSEDKNVCISL